ncbi:hypothetical protein FIBSPDRAFT_967106 [Athelia psychrophila]|uniref:Uncharacterized protein n=1 Tax=Athelia psychrophila TaxID=1759441 RepID=A0A167W2M0_9AGAM|nr:hypothetical protein FIBSPDRAFT_967106 [Fibularhizoctonia sp. CBS 109695]
MSWIYSYVPVFSNTNLQPYLHEKEIEVNSLNSKLNSLNSKVPSLNQTLLDALEHNQEQKCTVLVQEPKIEEKEHAFRLSILEQDIAKGKDTIDNYHSKMGQADTGHPLLQERFDEQPLTLRITKEANGDLDVSLNDLDEQLKGCRVLAQSNTHPVDMAVIPQRYTAFKLIADKCQTDLVMIQQTHTTLNGRLVDMAVTEEENASLKVIADKC